MEKVILIGILVAIVSILNGCAISANETTNIRAEVVGDKVSIKFPKHIKISGSRKSEIKEQIRKELIRKPEAEKVTFNLEEQIELSDILILKNQNYNAITARNVLRQFYDNHIASGFRYTEPYVMPPLEGVIWSVKERDHDYELHLDPTGLLPSRIHKIDKVLVRISKKKLRDLNNFRGQDPFKSGDLIKVEGFLSKENNNIIISAQGRYVLRSRKGLTGARPAPNGRIYFPRPNPKIFLGITLDIEIIRPEQTERVFVGKPEPIIDLNY